MKEKIQRILLASGASVCLTALLGIGFTSVYYNNLSAREAYTTLTQTNIRAASEHMREWAASNPYDAQPLWRAYNELVAARDSASEKTVPSGLPQLEDVIQNTSIVLNGINHGTTAGEQLARERSTALVARVNRLRVSEPMSNSTLASWGGVVAAGYGIMLALIWTLAIYKNKPVRAH